MGFISGPMDDAHRRDSADERTLRDASRIIEVVADALGGLHRTERAEIQELRAVASRLRARADHIVAVWD